MLIVHAWTIVTLPPDSTYCQTAHDLILEQDINQSDRDCTDDRSSCKHTLRLGEGLGYEKKQSHHQSELFNAPYQNIGKDEFLDGPYERENPNHRKDRTQAHPIRRTTRIE